MKGKDVVYFENGDEKILILKTFLVIKARMSGI